MEDLLSQQLKTIKIYYNGFFVNQKLRRQAV